MTASERALESMHLTATAIFQDALNACNIESAFDRRIRFSGEKNEILTRLHPDGIGPDTLTLKDYSSIQVIAIGKAAHSMLDTLLSRMKRRSGVRGICCGTSIPEKKNWRIRYFEGGHPLPNEDSFAAARAALALLRKARKDTLVLFLISGGASALFDLPLDPDLTLEDAIGFHNALIGSGAPITEINTVRKHFSAVKGGRLAVAAAEATKLSILLPDVPLRSLDTVASGPTSPDHSTVEEVRAILAKYDLLAKFPPAVRAFFEREDLPESPGDKTRRVPFLPRLPWSDKSDSKAKLAPDVLNSEGEAFRDSMFEVLLSSHDLVENAQVLAQKAGFNTVIDNACDDWDYAAAAHYLLERFHALRAEHPRCCLISGGEVTVTIDRTPGAGGRNMQFALQCALELVPFAAENLVVLSAGSDGIDGNTRSAGAIADTTTIARAVTFGYQPTEELAAFNACPLFTSLGDTVVTGPTGHNLRDLRLLISNPT
jgi:glycerate 2-kinase